MRTGARDADRGDGRDGAKRRRMRRESSEKEYDELLNARASETIGEAITTADGRRGIGKNGDHAPPPGNVSLE
jgi:hypothetical protein